MSIGLFLWTLCHSNPTHYKMYKDRSVFDLPKLVSDSQWNRFQFHRQIEWLCLLAIGFAGKPHRDGFTCEYSSSSWWQVTCANNEVRQAPDITETGNRPMKRIWNRFQFRQFWYALRVESNCSRTLDELAVSAVKGSKLVCSVCMYRYLLWLLLMIGSITKVSTCVQRIKRKIYCFHTCASCVYQHYYFYSHRYKILLVAV